MKQKNYWLLLLFALATGNLFAQPCKMHATLSESGIMLNPRDPDFRDECKIYITAKNDGTCGWEKGKVKAVYRLKTFPTKAPRPSGAIVGGTIELEATAFPKANGKFKGFDLPPPEYHGIYVYQIYLIDNDNKTFSNVVEIEINWD